MKKSLISGSLGALALLGSSLAMGAQVVVVSSNNLNPNVGDVFQVTLQMTGGTNIGGGTYSMSWDTSTATLQTSSLPATGPVAIGTGTFLVAHTSQQPTFWDLLPGAPPVNGNFDFAVYTFQATANGPMKLQVFENTANFDGWFDNDTAEPIPTSYQDASITIGQVVPVPAAAWLIAPAVLAAGRFSRRRKAA